MARKKIIIGIDEVGRGALAGPVTVAVVAIPENVGRQAPGIKCSMKDSKKLTAKQREEWFRYLVSHPKVDYAIARVYPRQIDKRNIAGAANLAAKRAYKRLVLNGGKSIGRHKVFLDGGLYLGSKEAQTIQRKKIAKTIVRGDEKIKAVAAASIVAKVNRDRLMARLAKTFPEYGFEVHKGYGTRRHIEAIRRCGPSSVHRQSFVKNI